MVSSATASALRPGVRMTGTPAAVAALTSTLFGSPRVAATAKSGSSKTVESTKSASTTTMSAPSAMRRSASPARRRS